MHIRFNFIINLHTLAWMMGMCATIALGAAQLWQEHSDLKHQMVELRARNIQQDIENERRINRCEERIDELYAKRR